MTLINIALSALQYFAINSLIQRYQTRKLANNSCSFIHASSTVVLWLFGTPTMMMCNSGGYFLFDMYYLFKNSEFNFMNFLYYYHHTAFLYYMNLSPVKYNWVNILGFGELSNIPNYFVYYYLKTDPGAEQLKRWKIVQKIWYGGIRTIGASILTYYEVNHPERFWKVLPVVPLYGFGLLWAGFIIKQ